MLNILRRIASTVLLISPTGLFSISGAPNWQSAVDKATHHEPDARIIVIDVSSGHMLGAYHLEDAARSLVAPGSTLKPLILYSLLKSRNWNAERRIACRGELVIAGHALRCSHPRSAPFDAREALAWSCNAYFASIGRMLRPGELGGMLSATGILSATGLAPTEARAEFHEPHTPIETQLTVLGIEGVRVTPLELAAAYRWLANDLSAHTKSLAAATVREGLADSASFGMASAAGLGAVSVAGKTGTAEGVNSHKSHGWFAGMTPVSKPQAVIVVYLPTGRGSDAARLAGLILADSPLRQR